MSEENQAPAEGVNEQDVDALYDSVMEPKGPTIVDTKKEGEPETYTLAEGANVSKDELMEYAKQGWEAKSKMSEWEQQQTEFKDKFGYYENIDSWAKENPDAWQHIVQQYENNNLTQTQEQTYNNNETENLPKELHPYIDKINALELKLQTFEDKENLRTRQQEDESLDTEIQSVKDEYKDFDFKGTDEGGKTLESKVLEHAANIGVDSFKVAFRDLMYDKIVSREREKGMETINKDLARKTKLGLLGESKESLLGLKKTTDHKNKSYDDLMDEALSELNSGS